MKKAVITGATGVIGRALLNELIKNKFKVLVIARESPVAEGLREKENTEVIFCDLTSLSSLSINEKYDYFFHLGWIGTRGDLRLDESLQEENINVSLEAVKLAKRLGCKCFIGVGSQAEYGRVKSGIKLSPQLKEEPISAYGKAKLKARNECLKLCNDLNIRFNWCRVLSSYGIGDNENSFVMHIINNSLNGEICELTPCEQQWDYIFNEDIARGLLLIAEKGKNNQTYVIGSGKHMQLKEYAKIIFNCVGNANARLKFGAIDYYPDQVMYLCADISALTEDTGFKPQVSFEEGIKKILESKKH